MARFTNAAEAGYFAHELLREAGIPATVTLDESFDALSGHWSTRFVLAVPHDSTERAALCLKRLLGQTEPDDVPFDTEFDANEISAPIDRDEWRERPSDVMAIDGDRESGVNWVPIVLTLAAGSVVFWGVRAMQVPPHAKVAAGERQADIWSLLSEPERPWVQQLDKGRRELRFDSVSREGVLLEDRDGDGRFETEIRVPARF